MYWPWFPPVIPSCNCHLPPRLGPTWANRATPTGLRITRLPAVALWQRRRVTLACPWKSLLQPVPTGSREGVMAEGKFIAYLRVSTARQGRSGLGLEAQRKAVEDFLNGGNWRLVKELVEVESGDAHFLLGLRDAGIDFVCADMPEIDRFTVGIHALVA